jgi:predicted Fe-Mo cluster-binding NifX family protein
MRQEPGTLLCLACYKDRLASVCENADEYKLFEIRDDTIYPAGRLSLPSKDPMDRTSAILACGVTLLLCGAIGADTRSLLEGGGVRVVPWLTGAVDEVVAALAHDSLTGLTMPGSPGVTGRA